METEPKLDISEEQMQVYDRQRFIGIEVQKRLINAKVYLTPINGVMTELAKNLILCGTSIAIADEKKIDKNDFETNFLFGIDDIGAERGQTAKNRLSEMNPMVEITLHNPYNIREIHEAVVKGSEKSEEILSFFKRFDILSVSTADFEEMEMWNDVSRAASRPLYILVCCGLYGFAFVDLGAHFEYTISKKEKEEKEAEDKKVEEKQISTFKIADSYDFNKTRAKNIYYGILMMREAQRRGLSYNAFSQSAENSAVLEEIVALGDKLFHDKIKNFNENSRSLLRDFARLFGIEYCPVYSVVGGIVSQEFIKIIGRNAEPCRNWLCYDSQEGYGFVERVEPSSENAKSKISEPQHIEMILD